MIFLLPEVAREVIAILPEVIEFAQLVIGLTPEVIAVNDRICTGSYNPCTGRNCPFAAGDRTCTTSGRVVSGSDKTYTGSAL